MTVIRTKTFRSGNSQAMRLPPSVAFGEDADLVIVRSGDVMTIYPAKLSIAAMVALLCALPAPPVIEERDLTDLPERKDL